MDKPEKLATQCRKEEEKKTHAICVGHHFAQTNTQDIIHVNNTRALIITTGGKDELNNGYVRTLKLETQNGLYADARYPLVYSDAL